MSASFSASVLFRVCLPMVSWAGRVPSTTEFAAPGSIGSTANDMPDTINRLIQGAYRNAGALGISFDSTSFTDAPVALQGGNEWDLHRADGSTPDLSRWYFPGTSSARMDIGANSGSGFVSAEQRATRIARFDRGNGSSARRRSRGEKGSRVEVMDPDAPAGQC
jgi:hypothetical protein